jgi:hypothetical protein
MSKVASHGPADVEGASMIARDAPAQVDSRGRRRDGSLGFTIVRVACGGGEEGRTIRTSPWRSAYSSEPLADMGFTTLADALGVFCTILPRITFGAVAPLSAVPLLLRNDPHR